MSMHRFGQRISGGPWRRLLGAALVVALTVGVVASPAVQANPDPEGDTGTLLVPICFGKPATILGTAGPDTLVGTIGADVIIALGGNDTVYGLDGHDLICTGPGDDRVYAGPGHDRISGGSGNDRLYGEGGFDHLDGGPHTVADNCDGGPPLMGDTAANCEGVFNVP